ncbi:MAG: IS66 family insertion sequence element accessory protein TnpB [Verrucomicrobiota bacterium]
MTETHEIILKSDRRGRIRFTPEQRTAMVDAYDTSGLSRPKFAKLHGVNYQAFAGWFQRRKIGHAPVAASAGLFTLLAATAHSQPGSSCARLEGQLPGGARLLIDNMSRLSLAASLIRELQLPNPC